ncbi:helix-turn-helix transcriptional regulator [Marivibrio halodurans]|uniref:Helix-turn-helix transcriptional regulator n=1 Tax=Marivibrio halodurans TaxID=2039722 RepID=A0A8J7RW71_9PROT|nr:helix-turn-helix transcriptional regulator [Marivibrio halodurans]MBP5855665.1 helix-turn-helix transcriptional regulator [Marivibrio halodurans]
MAHSKYRVQTEEAKQKRKEVGSWIKKLRQDKDLTQAALAKRLGFDYYTFVSSVENGANRVPPEGMRYWAEALGVGRRDFAKRLLAAYDPYMFEELFGPHSKED